MNIRLLANLLVFMLFSVVATSQIPVNTNFEIFSNQPIDTRATIPTLADTASIAWDYAGLPTYVVALDQFWYYNGSYWVEFVPFANSIYNLLPLGNVSIDANLNDLTIDSLNNLFLNSGTTMLNSDNIVLNADNLVTLYGLNQASIYSDSGNVILRSHIDETSKQSSIEIADNFIVFDADSLQVFGALDIPPDSLLGISGTLVTRTSLADIAALLNDGNGIIDSLPNGDVLIAANHHALLLQGSAFVVTTDSTFYAEHALPGYIPGNVSYIFASAPFEIFPGLTVTDSLGTDGYANVGSSYDGEIYSHLVYYRGGDTSLVRVDAGGVIVIGDTMDISGVTTLIGFPSGADGNGIFDATNDGDTTAIGAFTLGQSLYIDADGNDFGVSGGTIVAFNTQGAGSSYSDIETSPGVVELQAGGFNGGSNTDILMDSTNIRFQADSIELSSIDGTGEVVLFTEVGTTQSISIIAEDVLKLWSNDGEIDMYAPSVIVIDSDTIIKLAGPNIEFFGSYVWENDIPSNTVGDTSIHVWVGDGVGTAEPMFIDIDVLGGGGGGGLEGAGTAHQVAVWIETDSLHSYNTFTYNGTNLIGSVPGYVLFNGDVQASIYSDSGNVILTSHVQETGMMSSIQIANNFIVFDADTIQIFGALDVAPDSILGIAGTLMTRTAVADLDVNSIYNLLPNQTVTIDPNNFDLQIGTAAANNTGEFEFYALNADSRDVTIYAGTGDSSSVAFGEGFFMDAFMSSFGAQDGIIGVNYDFIGDFYNVAAFGDSIYIGPYPSTDLSLFIANLPRAPLDSMTAILASDWSTGEIYILDASTLGGGPSQPGFESDSIIAAQDTLTLDLESLGEKVFYIDMTSANATLVILLDNHSDPGNTVTTVFTVHFLENSGTDPITWPSNFYDMQGTALGTDNIIAGTKYTLYYNPILDRWYAN